ncbi:MAG: AMP-binding protein [Pseudonocardiaceae bacterium]|nr:AMP-binding protein [Pseudonocardiaceae bacterium]
MMATWTSTNGITLRDLVPARLRRDWVDKGWCPDRDLYSLFGEAARTHPGRTAVVDSAGTTDYATLDASVRRVATALMEAGYGERDVIGIQAPNDRRAVAAELAVAAIGAVALPFPPGRGWRDTVTLLGRSRASAMIVADTAGDTPLAENLTGLRPRLPDLGSVFVFGEAPAGCRSLDPWLLDDAVGREWRPQPPVNPEGPARILVSSGSEAEPKMVAYSHNAMAGGRANYVAALSDGRQPMRNLVLVPLFSSFGSCGTSVTVARHGGTLLLLDTFDSATALRMITRHRPTDVFGVPTMLRRMAAERPTPGEDTSSLHALVASGAALHTTTIEACQERFGCPIINVYGSADGINCHTAVEDSPPELGRVGRPDPKVAEIRIVGDDGVPLPAGQQGEIWARGPMTPLCYLNAVELDERYRPPGGWVRTGDCGLIDSEGQLQVVDRIKQVVIRGGYNISPAEIEQQLDIHPVVADAVCLAMPDPELGERLCACVTQQPGTATLTLAAINAFLENERGLDRRKLPESLVVLPELPLGPTGKVCRQTLARLAALSVGERDRLRAGVDPESSRSGTKWP